jgi:hypothetical protein
VWSQYQQADSRATYAIRDEFALEVKAYTLTANIENQFPGIFLEHYGSVVPPFSPMLEHLVNRIVACTTQGSDPEGVHLRGNRFINAGALRHSRSLDTLVDSRNLWASLRQEMAQRLKRRLRKFASTSALRQAIPYRWVTVMATHKLGRRSRTL